MTKLKIKCPNCGARLRGVTSDMIGDIGVCPSCRAEFQISDPNEAATAVGKMPCGPRGDDYVCTNCHIVFRRDGSPKRSFLGFEGLTCPECSHAIKYPLTGGYRRFYWCFIIVVPLICFAIIYFGGGAALPGLAWFAAILALWYDFDKQRKVQEAWYAHERKGHPRTDKGGRAPSPIEQDPIRWFHVVFALLLPYVAAPWGIVNLVRGKRRSGILLLVIPAVLFGVMMTIAFVASWFQR